MRRSEAFLAAALLASIAVNGWQWHSRSQDHAGPINAPTPLQNGSPVPTSSAEESISEASIPHTATSATLEDFASDQRRLLRDTQYREAWRTSRRVVHLSRKNEWIRFLRFSHAEADALVEALIDREQQQAQIPLLIQHDAETLRQIEKISEDSLREYREKAVAVVGEAGWAKLNYYQDSRPARNLVDRYRNQLPDADFLPTSRIEPLVAVVHTESSRYQKELEALRDSLDWQNHEAEAQRTWRERRPALQASSHQRIGELAARFLTTGQLRALEALLESDRLALEAQADLQALSQERE